MFYKFVKTVEVTSSVCICADSLEDAKQELLCQDLSEDSVVVHRHIEEYNEPPQYHGEYEIVEEEHKVKYINDDDWI